MLKSENTLFAVVCMHICFWRSGPLHIYFNRYIILHCMPWPASGPLSFTLHRERIGILCRLKYGLERLLCRLERLLCPCVRPCPCVSRGARGSKRLQKKPPDQVPRRSLWLPRCPGPGNWVSSRQRAFLLAIRLPNRSDFWHGSELIFA